MSDRELAWAVINCDRTDGEATDAAARYVSELEQSIERCQALNRMWIVADRMVCEPCAASVRSTFALAATLGRISGVDLLMAVCDT